MRKYPVGENIVGAIYDNGPLDNPFVAALPEMLGQKEFRSQIQSFPKLPHNLSQMTAEERRQALPVLSSIFIPMGFMYVIYDQLYRAIRTTYTTRSIVEGIRQTIAIIKNISSN